MTALIIVTYLDQKKMRNSNWFENVIPTKLKIKPKYLKSTCLWET